METVIVWFRHDLRVADNPALSYAVAQGQLDAIDVRGGTPQLRGTLDLGDAWGQQLLLHGDRLLVIANGWGGGGGVGIAISPDAGRFASWWGEPTTTLTEIDVSDPAAMQVLDTLSMDASFVSARQVDATVRLVVRTFTDGPQLEYVTSDALAEQTRVTWRWPPPNGSAPARGAFRRVRRASNRADLPGR